MTEKEIIERLMVRHPMLEKCEPQITEACHAIIRSYQQQGKLLVCGNGGSAADADHIAAELMKSFMKHRPIEKEVEKNLREFSDERGSWIAGKLQGALPAISLNAHTSLLTAIANDIDASLIFAQQVAGYGNPGDILLALSTSGNSRNILDAIITARAIGLKVVGLTGRTGGSMQQICDILIPVPAETTPEIQELHLPVYHTICMVVENALFT